MNDEFKRFNADDELTDLIDNLSPDEQARARKLLEDWFLSEGTHKQWIEDELKELTRKNFDRWLDNLRYGVN